MSIVGTLSRESSASADDDDEDENGEDDPKKVDKKLKKKFFRLPFMMRMLKFNAPEWPWILLGTIFSIVYGAVQPLFALFFAQIYGLFAEPDLEKQKHLTSVYAAAIFLIGLGGGVAQFLSIVGFAKSGEALTMRMRKMTFAAMLRQEIAYFDYESNSVGALVTRLTSDASALKVIFATNHDEEHFFWSRLGSDWCTNRYYTPSC